MARHVAPVRRLSFSRTLQVLPVFALGVALSCSPGLLPTASAAQTLCADLGIVPSEEESLDPLAGYLGSSRESFEARFGPPTEEDSLSVQWEIEGCGTMFASFEQGLLTDVSIYQPDFEIGSEGMWLLSEATAIAARFLPADVQMSRPYRNVSFVEHHECYSDALAATVPASVYAYVDNNPTQGQCSAVYGLDDLDRVTDFTVQLQIEDPN